MVKNKALPDSAAHPQSGLSLSLSLSLADAVHPEGTPGSCWGWTPAPTQLLDYETSWGNFNGRD